MACLELEKNSGSHPDVILCLPLKDFGGLLGMVMTTLMMENIHYVTESPQWEEPGGLQSMGSLSRTRLSDFTFTFHS